MNLGSGLQYCAGIDKVDLGCGECPGGGVATVFVYSGVLLLLLLVLLVVKSGHSAGQVVSAQGHGLASQSQQQAPGIEPVPAPHPYY